MDFTFYVTVSRDTGVRLFDLKYKGKRILYEVMWHLPLILDHLLTACSLAWRKRWPITRKRSDIVLREKGTYSSRGIDPIQSGTW